MRSLEELIDNAEPGLELVQRWIEAGTNEVHTLSATREAGNAALLDLQVTTRSPMGALAHGTGGLLVDGGWIRVLGAGCERLPRAISGWNRMHGGRAQRLEGAIVVGDDVLGGFFALSGGGIPVPPGRVGYFAPDALAWEDTELGYSAWLAWLFEGNLEQYYEGMRWTGWRKEIESLPGDAGMHIYPPLWAKGPPIDERSRGSVPLEELWSLNVQGRGE